MTDLRKAIRLSLCLGVSLGTTALPVVAAGEPPAAQRDDRSLRSHAAPLLVYTREEILRSGHLTLADWLQELPWAGPALNPNFNYLGDGSTRMDLRGLGDQRVLVLIDGQRWNGVTTDAVPSADLGLMPLVRVERVEILLDSASAAYGADAVAGVVNIVTRRGLEGIEASAAHGRYTAGDGAQTSLDLAAGMRWRGGGLQFSASRYSADQVSAGDRRISREPLWGTGTGFSGSSATPHGRLIISDAGPPFSGGGATRDSGGDATPTADDFRPYTLADHYNFAADGHLATPSTRTGLALRLDQDLGEHFAVGLEYSRSSRESERLLTSLPLTIGQSGAFADGARIGIHATNPYNFFGVDLAPSFNDPGLHLQGLQRRLVETGGRSYRPDVVQDRWVAEVDGDLELASRHLAWRAWHTVTDTRTVEAMTGQVDYTAIARALGPVVDCTAPCVPLNLFGGAGSITAPMLAYISPTLESREARHSSETRLEAGGALIDVPGGALDLRLGHSRREESATLRQDPRLATGSYSIPGQTDLAGEYRVDETDALLTLPLLTEHLESSIAARRSDLGPRGTVDSHGLALRWQATATLALHASRQDGYRHPTIDELFAAPSQVFPAFADPCSSVTASANDQLIANCTGVVTGGAVPLITGPFVPASGIYVQTLGPDTFLTGNPALRPERSRNQHLGFTWSPSAERHLELSLTHWSLRVADVIDQLTTREVLGLCYGNHAGTLLGGEQSACDLLTRDPNGSPTHLELAALNLETRRIDGVDLSLRWTPDVAWRVAWDASRIASDRHTDPLGRVVDSVGTNAGDQAKPRWRSLLTVDWSTGPWAATWRTRFIGRQTEFCSSSYVAAGFPCSDAANDRNRLGATTYHDAQVSYDLSAWDLRLSFGVRNLGDKRPPLSAQAFANSFEASTYEVPGRFPYLRVAARF